MRETKLPRNHYSRVFFAAMVVLLFVSIAQVVFGGGPGFGRVRFDQGLLSSPIPPSGSGGRRLMSVPEGAETDPEIIALATSLGDHRNIFEYVRNNIEYEPYWGSLKGAMQTLYEKKGNDLDQASLLFALLQASPTAGCTECKYVYGMKLEDHWRVANWLDVPDDFYTNTQVIIDILQKVGGISDVLSPFSGWIQMGRVLVRARIGGTDYYFDPLQKHYERQEPIPLLNYVPSYDLNGVLTAAGGTYNPPDSITGLNETNILGQLMQFAGSISPSVSVDTVLGHHRIVPEFLSNDPSHDSGIGYYAGSAPLLFFDSIEFDAGDQYYNENFKHIVTISFPPAVGATFEMPEVTGRRVVVKTTADGTAILYLEDEQKETGTVGELTITVNHPHSLPIPPSSTILRSDSMYCLAINSGRASSELIQKRKSVLDANRRMGYEVEHPERVLGESLYVMAVSYSNESAFTDAVLARFRRTGFVLLHDVGVFAQEKDRGYYVDLPIGGVVAFSKAGEAWENDDSLAWFYASGNVGSAYEHGIIEQLQGTPGVSTVKVLSYANAQGTPIVSTTDGNGNRTIQPSPSGVTITDPATNNTWSGTGYIFIVSDQGYVGHLLQRTSGEPHHHGGEPFWLDPVEPVTFDPSLIPPLIGNPENRVQEPPEGMDPIDMLTGDYLYRRTDIASWRPEPLGLSFVRSYNSSVCDVDRGMGPGWSHSYDIFISSGARPKEISASGKAADIGFTLVGLYTLLDLMRYEDNVRGWVLSSLIAKMVVDRMKDSVLNVRAGHKVTILFLVQQPKSVHVRAATGSDQPACPVERAILRGTAVERANRRHSASIAITAQRNGGMRIRPKGP